MCVSGVPESQKVFTASPGMPGALAEALHKIAELYPNGKKNLKPTQIAGTVQNSKAHNPLPERNEAQDKTSEHTYRARHPQPVLLSCSISLQSALLQLSNHYSIINPELL